MSETEDTWVPRHITTAKIAVRLRDLVGNNGIVTASMVGDALKAEGIHSENSARSYVVELMARGYVKHGILTRDALHNQELTIHITPRGACKDVEQIVRDALSGYEGVVEIRMGGSV